ncbi:MAG: hypothetical protein KC493_17270 [Bacteriovoracaceae bacterium]|nr:hypothetical protein [Bacteriovoracaceae bacterium]
MDSNLSRYPKKHLAISVILLISALAFFIRNAKPGSGYYFLISIIILLCFVFYLEFGNRIGKLIDEKISHSFMKAIFKFFSLVSLFFINVFLLDQMFSIISNPNSTDELIQKCREQKYSFYCHRRAKELRYKEKDKISSFKVLSAICHSNDADACNSGAWLVAKNRKLLGDHLQSAIQMSEKSIQLGPKKEYFYSTLALVHYVVGNKEKAIASQKDAINLHEVLMKKGHTSFKKMCETRQRNYIRRLKSYESGVSVDKILLSL